MRKYSLEKGRPRSRTGQGKDLSKDVVHPKSSFSVSYGGTWGFAGGSDSKESACNAGHTGSVPGLGRSPGGGHGNPLQCSCLENPHGQRSLVGYSPWGRKDLDTTGWLSTAQHSIVCLYSSVPMLIPNSNLSTHPFGNHKFMDTYIFIQWKYWANGRDIPIVH